MEIIQSTPQDANAIMHLYDVATEYQKTVAPTHWLGFDPAIIETAIKEKRQWKIVENGQIACVFTLTFDDLLIWKEKNADPAIYIHRIATNPMFRGKGYVKTIVAWAKGYAKANGKAFIRMDTGSGNEKLNNYYVSCGFAYMGLTEMHSTEGLPAHYKQYPFSLFEIKMVQFDFVKSYILEDERVLLRPLEMNDLEHLLPFSLQEPNLWQYSLVQANGRANLENYLQLAVNAREAQKEYPFIVFDKKQGQYAGSTRFYDIQLALDTLQLGYTWYGQAFQGTGLNRHCKHLLLTFAFETLGMERVEFRADNRNERSKAAMKSIGCTVEGVLRSNMPTISGPRRDSIVLSILKDEWFGGVKANLTEKIGTSSLKTPANGGFFLTYK